MGNRASERDVQKNWLPIVVLLTEQTGSDSIKNAVLKYARNMRKKLRFCYIVKSLKLSDDFSHEEPSDES
jgi:uncharacterized protein YegL